MNHGQGDMEEPVGFEPTHGFTRLAVFETAPLYPLGYNSISKFVHIKSQTRFRS